MDNEQKNDLRVLGGIKAKMIKWGIGAIVVMIALVIIFITGYSNATKKYEDIIADLSQEVDGLNKQLAEKAVEWETTPTTEITTSLIKSEIMDIGELATVEYFYTDAGKFEDPKQALGKNIPFTTISLFAKWDGIIKAGVKIDEIAVKLL